MSSSEGPTSPQQAPPPSVVIPPSMQLTPARLQLTETVLGDGSFARVVLGTLLPPTAAAVAAGGGGGAAMQLQQPMQVAVKMVRKDKANRAAFSSLQAEIDICANLSHPCLINTHCVLDDGPHILIVMDLAQGGELQKYIQRFGLDDMDLVAANFVAEAALGLEYMHSRGVIHRDVKLSNLLLTGEYHVKLSDFGTVCRADDDEATSKFTGTPLYVSPEVLKAGGRAVFASDLWALGCIVYELYVGRPPFQGDSQYLVLQAIKERRLEFPPYFPAAARDLVDRLLDPDPESRLGAPTARGGGYAALKAHPYFSKVDWLTVTTRSNVTHLNADHTKKWEMFLLKNERVVYSSRIVKERYALLPTSAKERILILTDFPRLFYIEPGSNSIKGQVPWSNEMFAHAESNERFTVSVPGRDYNFVDADKRAALWASKINDQVKRKK